MLGDRLPAHLAEPVRRRLRVLRTRVGDRRRPPDRVARPAGRRDGRARRAGRRDRRGRAALRGGDGDRPGGRGRTRAGTRVLEPLGLVLVQRAAPRRRSHPAGKRSSCSAAPTTSGASSTRCAGPRSRCSSAETTMRRGRSSRRASSSDAEVGQHGGETLGLRGVADLRALPGRRSGHAGAGRDGRPRAVRGQRFAVGGPVARLARGRPPPARRPRRCPSRRGAGDRAGARVGVRRDRLVLQVPQRRLRPGHRRLPDALLDEERENFPVAGERAAAGRNVQAVRGGPRVRGGRARGRGDGALPLVAENASTSSSSAPSSTPSSHSASRG